MLALLADPANTCNTPWWNTFTGPTGVVLGALIAGAFNWWNARKTVYDRLESLVTVRKEWPGTDTIDHSVALALADIRRHEPGNEGEATTPALQRLVREASLRETQRLVTSTVGFALLAGLASLLAPLAGAAAHSGQSWVLWIVVAVVALVVVVGIVVMSDAECYS